MRAVYQPLAESVRELIDATIRTEVDADAVAAVKAEIDAATARLRSKQCDGPFGVRTSIHIDSSHSVAIDFAQHGDATGGDQKFKCIVGHQHPARHAVRQAMAENEERAACLFLGNHMLDLR